MPPPPQQRRRSAGVARRPQKGRHSAAQLAALAHLRTAGREADTAHGQAGGTDRRAMGRIQPRR